MGVIFFYAMFLLNGSAFTWAGYKILMSLDAGLVGKIVGWLALLIGIICLLYGVMFMGGAGF